MHTTTTTNDHSKCCNILKCPIITAAANGDLETVKASFDPKNKSVGIMHCAAKHGQFEVMMWILDASKGGESPLNSYVFTGAAHYGDLSILKWLKHHGCPFDSMTMTAAVSSGKLENVKWLCSAGCRIGNRSFTLAAEHGNLSILNLLSNLSENGQLSAFEDGYVMKEEFDHYSPEIKQWFLGRNFSVYLDLTDEEVAKNPKSNPVSDGTLYNFYHLQERLNSY